VKQNVQSVIGLSIALYCVYWGRTAMGSQTVGSFPQELRTNYSERDGLPDNDVQALAACMNGEVYAGTRAGLGVFAQGKWHTMGSLKGKAVWMLACQGNTVVALTGRSEGEYLRDCVIHIITSQRVVRQLPVPGQMRVRAGVKGLALSLAESLYLSASDDIYVLDLNQGDEAVFVDARPLKLRNSDVRQIAVNREGELYVAAKSGLLGYHSRQQRWTPVYPQDGQRSWAPVDVRAVTFDSKGRLWFASPQGVGCRDGQWTLYTGQDGLPYNDFTVAAPGQKGEIWFGTRIGAIRFDGSTWAYRQGKRWLAHDALRDIVVSPNGHAWFATKNGISVMERRAMTLAQKAQWYEAEIDRYHRRTPYEYVLEVGLGAPGDKSAVHRHDSDNDGLWTSMYGAGECFAYAATQDPTAQQRAQKVFEAMHFLGQVTRGGTHPAPSGYVARTILPTSGPNPNIGRIERDRREQQQGDRLWKVYEPRWPTSADGQWYWKSDTSSDELDGHYFFYALYYDLVAHTEAEKKRVRSHVKALTDHLIEHDFQLVDHDGTPTRWARYSPGELNFDQNWFVERGLNSLSMLSYLAVTAHITGDPKYQRITETLINQHSYLQNMMNMKYQRGIGTGNQSDDEMAFMCYYTLLKYAKDPERRSKYAISFWQHWRLEQPEMNPFFNFVFAASCSGLSFTDAWGAHSTDPTGDWLVDALFTLKHFPLDRINWRHTNSHRIDLVRLPEASRAFDENKGEFNRRGYRTNGKVIPVDECYFNHWNRNAWHLDTGGDGRGMGDGAVFLLPYYMGLYHGFIQD
jgi:hypothetical protein